MSLMTLPRLRSSDRIGLWSPFRVGSVCLSAKSVAIRSATVSMSVSKLAVQALAKTNASSSDLLISLLPPPETVAGLWHWVAIGEMPSRCHWVLSASRGFEYTR